MLLTKANYLLFAAHSYTNDSCIDTEEFIDDLKRINHIKKILNKYKKTGEINERLILNHLVILTNVFVVENLNKMLFLELENYWDCIKPFLEFMNILPSSIVGIGEGGNIIITNTIPTNDVIKNKLSSLDKKE